MKLPQISATHRPVDSGGGGGGAARIFSANLFPEQRDKPTFVV